MNDDVIFGWIEIFFGAVLLFVTIYFWIYDAIRGVRQVNGTIIGEDIESKTVHIKYKIKGDTFNEVSCPLFSHYFICGPPEVGMKIVLKIRKDDPYKVVSIHTTLKSHLTSFSKPGIYSNNYVWKIPLLLLPLSAFCLLMGVLLITDW
ncbi:MAG: hypothetical protein IKJ60_04665 [Ruminococcus sp.]|nr:hypothetical protein [Ruminococcus sp.]